MMSEWMLWDQTCGDGMKGGSGDVMPIMNNERLRCWKESSSHLLGGASASSQQVVSAGVSVRGVDAKEQDPKVMRVRF